MEVVNMGASLQAVFLMDDEQYKYFEKLSDQVSSVALIDELGKYPLGADDCGYYAVQAEVISNFNDNNQLIRFLSTAFRYVCMRIEGTNYVFTSSAEDLYDLYEDFYSKRGGGKSLQKDLLTIEERYNIIFESNSYWSILTSLCLIYKDEIADDIMLLDLDENTPELFVQDDELLITEELTGETHTVDLTLGIKDNFLTFMVLKKLEKPHENIL